MSLSSWNYVAMESPVPVTVYLYVFLGIIGLGGVELWLLRRFNGQRPETKAS